MGNEVATPSKQDILTFVTHLAERICGGQALLPSLREIQDSLAAHPMAAVAGDVADAVEGGKTLSDAMAQQPGVFNEAVVALVRGGEVAGLLDHILALIVECSWRYPGKVV